MRLLLEAENSSAVGSPGFSKGLTSARVQAALCPGVRLRSSGGGGSGRVVPAAAPPAPAPPPRRRRHDPQVQCRGIGRQAYVAPSRRRARPGSTALTCAEALPEASWPMPRRLPMMASTGQGAPGTFDSFCTWVGGMRPSLSEAQHSFAAERGRSRSRLAAATTRDVVASARSASASANVRHRHLDPRLRVGTGHDHAPRACAWRRTKAGDGPPSWRRPVRRRNAGVGRAACPEASA